MLDERFVLLGALIGSLGSISYLVATIQGRARPNRVTFFFWALAPLIAFVAELAEGVRIQSVMTLMVGLSPLAIFIASFVNRQSEWRLTRFDVGCGVLALAGIALWSLTREGTLAILFSIAADGFAAIPTILKSYSVDVCVLRVPRLHPRRYAPDLRSCQRNSRSAISGAAPHRGRGRRLRLETAKCTGGCAFL